MQTNKTTKTDLFNIDPRNIVVMEGFNSRVDFDIDDLVVSVKENGVLNPITVMGFKDTTDLDENGKPKEKYKLVDGERRYRAVMRAIEEGADISRVPAIKIPKLSDEELLRQQVVRNDGKPFNEYEYGIVCYKFKSKFGKTNSEISRIIGKNPGCVKYYLDHLERDERIQELLKTGQISGAEIRRIYKDNKDKNGGELNEMEVVRDILDGKKEAEKKGKAKITSNDLIIDGKNLLSVKRSDAIRKGLHLLLDTYNKYSKNGQVDIELDILDVLSRLDKKETIDDIFSSYTLKKAE